MVQMNMSKLARALIRYTNKSTATYDPIFDKQIRELRPDWFIKTADENKKKLLEMAEKKGPRPPQKTKLGKSLSRYTSELSDTYDCEFRRNQKTVSPLV